MAAVADVNVGLLWNAESKRIFKLKIFLNSHWKTFVIVFCD